jgi:multisubunit Na+/H+ antiporter MnhB subunit
MTDILIGFAALTVGAFIFGLIVLAIQKMPNWFEALCGVIIVISVMIFFCFTAGQMVRSLFQETTTEDAGSK